MNNNKYAAMMEKKQEMLQQRHEAGSVATNFPEVANIVMNMTYNQRGPPYGPAAKANSAAWPKT